MNIGQSLLEALETLNGNKLRSGLTILGIVIGVGAVIAMLAIGEGLSHDVVYSVVEDREGSLWIGTFGGGLNRLRDARFTVFTTRNGLPYDHVRSVFEDSQGGVWFATFGGGLGLLQDGRFTTLSRRDGLPNDRLFCVLRDRRGDLWVGTAGGGAEDDFKGSVRLAAVASNLERGRQAGGLDAIEALRAICRKVVNEQKLAAQDLGSLAKILPCDEICGYPDAMGGIGISGENHLDSVVGAGTDGSDVRRRRTGGRTARRPREACPGCSGTPRAWTARPGCGSSLPSRKRGRAGRW